MSCEVMAAYNKISKALRAAIVHLSDSMLAIDRKDDSSLEIGVWHVAAELEYALFLFSIAVEEEVDKSKWKLNSKLEKVEVGSMLGAVQDLLNEAEKCMNTEKVLDAYRNAYIARHCVLKIQKDFTKKKREIFKKKR